MIPQSPLTPEQIGELVAKTIGTMGNVYVSKVTLDGRGSGLVHLSNGTTLGRIMGITMEAPACDVPMMVLRVHAVSVDVLEDGIPWEVQAKRDLAAEEDQAQPI